MVLHDKISVSEIHDIIKNGNLRFFSKLILLLFLHFFQLCEDVSPEIEDFTRQPLKDLRSSGRDQGRKSHGIELSMPRFGNIVKLRRKDEMYVFSSDVFWGYSPAGAIDPVTPPIT
jgi:hypothetical protein